MENDNLTGPQQSLIHTDEDRIYEVQNVDLRNILERTADAFQDAWVWLSDFGPLFTSTPSMQEIQIAKDKINRVRCLCEDAKSVLLSTVNFYGSYSEPLNETLTCNTAMQQDLDSELPRQRIRADQDLVKIFGYLTLNELDLNWIIGTQIPSLLKTMKCLFDGHPSLISNICLGQMGLIVRALRQWKPERVAQRLFNPDLVELWNMHLKNNSIDSQIPNGNRTGEARDENQSAKKYFNLQGGDIEAVTKPKADQIVVLWPGAEHTPHNIRIARSRTAILESGGNVNKAHKLLRREGNRIALSTLYGHIKILNAINPEWNNGIISKQVGNLENGVSPRIDGKQWVPKSKQ